MHTRIRAPNIIRRRSEGRVRQGIPLGVNQWKVYTPVKHWFDQHLLTQLSSVYADFLHVFVLVLHPHF